MNSAGRTDPDWYRQSFGELYERVYVHRTVLAARHEIEELSRWAPLRPGDTVLDVGCGNGRHMAAMLAMGCCVTGCDLSADLIAVTAERPGLRNRVFRADMRALPVHRGFGRVVNLFTSFGYFQDDAENWQAFRNMADALAVGGVLILDTMNAGRVRRTLKPETVTEDDEYRIFERRWLREPRVIKWIDVERKTDSCRWEFMEDVRLLEPVEIVELARAAGFTSVTLHGGFSGEPFFRDSERMILRAQ
ncbi:methyltransferase domain-containing protein [bacterium]|nr:methyltransferase domain-containing protein [candidate division CSSED10-310 bacterium]